MVTQKLEEMVRRQNVLTKKLLYGKVDDAETEELQQLTEAIEAATAPAPAAAAKTTMRVMTLGEFQESADALMNGQPSPEELAVLKRNLSCIKDQGVTLADGAVAVEILVEMTAEEKIAALTKRVAELEAKGFDRRTNTGVRDDQTVDEVEVADATDASEEAGDAEKQRGKKPPFLEEDEDEDMKGKGKKPKKEEDAKPEKDGEQEADVSKGDEGKSDVETGKSSSWPTGDLAGKSMSAQEQFQLAKSRSNRFDSSVYKDARSLGTDD